MAKSIRIPLAGLALTTLTLAAAAQSSNAQAAQTRDYHIESQPLPAAVNDWADQAGLQVMWSAQMLGAQREAPEVAGRFSAPMALERVLQGSGLTFAFLDEQTVAIRLASAAGQSTSSQAAGKGGDQAMTRSADGAAQPSSSQEEGRGEDSKQSVRGADSTAASKAETISEVIVTGTQIRGVRPTSQVITITAHDAKASGVSTIQDLLSKVPQNFSGGVAEGTSAAFVPGVDEGANVGFGSGVNLRGLGSDATLILLNGQRLTSSSSGNFTDVSQIPLDAVDRIEVLADGASAVYGSDAIGGVVNIILKDSFSGVAVRGRHGEVTEGNLTETSSSLTAGHAWTTGHAMLGYDFYDKGSLSGASRDYSRPPVGDLIPSQKRHAIVLNGFQELGSQVSVFGDALYSQRDTTFLTGFAGSTAATNEYQTRSESYIANVGVSIDLPVQWRVTARGSTGRYEVDNKIVFRSYNYTGLFSGENKLGTFDVQAEGGLLELPAGEVRAVIGGSYRKEDYTEIADAGPARIDTDRNVISGYGELYIPLWSGTDSLSAKKEVALTVAARYDDYSDVGSTFNPRIGFLWRPSNQLNVRANYSTSFRAPNFTEAANYNSSLLLTRGFAEPGTTVRPLVLYQAGGAKPGMGPEEAASWNAGFDYEMQAFPGLRLSASYFSVLYEDRITQPSSAVYDILLNPAQYSAIINRNPTPADIAAAQAQAVSFIVLSSAGAGATPSQAQIIIDNRFQNLAQTRINGVDLSAAYSWGEEDGRWTASFTGTHFFKFENQISESSPSFSSLDTIYNPTATKIRGGLSWQTGHWDLNAFLNFINSYENTVVSPSDSIASWTTLDSSAGYEFDSSHGPFLSGLSARLSVINAFDRDPPRIATSASAALPTGYDPANANPLGRFLSIEIGKAF